MLSYEYFENGQNGPFLYLIGGDREEGARIFDLLQDQVSNSSPIGMTASRPGPRRPYSAKTLSEDTPGRRLIRSFRS